MQSQIRVRSTCDIVKYLILRAVHYHQVHRPSSLSQVCPGGQVFALQHWHMHCPSTHVIHGMGQAVELGIMIQKVQRQPCTIGLDTGRLYVLM